MSSPTGRSDTEWMSSALALARRGWGETWPNPTVGCVLVKDGAVLARGRTGRGGRPHGEAVALAAAQAAGTDVRGATAYVSLEPCAHHGRTPPCAEALVGAGIARCVVATGDPDPRVAGRGVAILRAAGIVVVEGVGRAEADEISAGFFCRVQQGRPLVTLKLATSLDGRIATAVGDSKWITGAPARARGHLLRAEHDGILVGIGTALADDPELTCRLPGLDSRSPVRIVADSGARLPVDSALVRSAPAVPLWLMCAEDAPADNVTALEACGVIVRRLPRGADGHVQPAALLQALGGQGMTRLLVEGGGTLAAALLAADLVDRLAIFRAGVVIGGDGIAAIGGFGLQRLASARRFARSSLGETGDDVLETWTRGA
ncbi:bifunctional diaminohydroxyphosphoribosylaminopyrimidine deaminase/5-amino-6-(5-phosphoribosylamino)uracil reductase RibD [Reyranella sp. CPCC 100927]|uniref:bifunctional diaminohydroxyphosphoribosylaminopyrimidine deaminase/5-amino-6-(5-phosphoribosylamino)uracil reductase RibD n=1 Tax=Reyranella sp. CPCC 100927 TaxID=2599616 RepID=UPI001C49B2F0|nr:bifunctional diaminohydroxyphosphoribosylaminopyrimidine deaminase/5-amino-6-(5-phosphoribosylamino)uracil reductase RibD [Reyranella sp. CPCC 100927]